MLTSVEGIYRKGRVELVEPPEGVPDDTRVIVIFLESNGIDLRARGIDRKKAAELRGQLEAFAEDWDSPEMSVYDDYNAASASRQTR